MRTAIAAICLCGFFASSAVAALPPGATKDVEAKGNVQVADYYSKGKVCRKAGSATVCN